MTDDKHGLTLIVKTVSRILVWVILLYGQYIGLHGHLTPGGGFGGGVVLALGLLSILLAYGRDFTVKWLKLPVLRKLDYTSALLFLAVGLVGLWMGRAFLFNFLPKGSLFSLLSSGVILPLNLIIGVKVGLSLFLVVLALAEFELDEGADE
jgi:multisubunit Na+/H+ antiporter MnhB subunit